MARVPLVTHDDLPEEYQHLFQVDEDDPADVVVNIHRALANNPRQLDAWLEWGFTLYDEVGDARTRELAILAVARTVESRYVWHQHVSIALDEGLSRSEILAISTQRFDEFPPAEAALLKYAAAVASDSVDDPTHEEFARYHDDSVVVTLTVLAAVYVAIDRMIDAMGVPLENEFVGWELQRDI